METDEEFMDTMDTINKMMLCSHCNKNIAVIFVTKVENNKTTNERLCLPCAKKLGIDVSKAMPAMNVNIDSDGQDRTSKASSTDISDNIPTAPMRAPVLCAGCPHRASFYAVKAAMKGRKANFSGDIGCYTLGNAMPLDMVDTCLCMGAGITMSQGLYQTDKETVNFAFVGDSTFFASGMTGVANAVYNQSDIIVCVLDNSTTAMTGHQPHPGTGVTMMGDVAEKISIEAVLKALGVKKVVTVNPLDLNAAKEAVFECADETGVKAIIFKSPCIAITRSTDKCVIDDSCITCKKCIREIGCPAISIVDSKVIIDTNLCTGCGLCAQICPTQAIRKEVL